MTSAGQPAAEPEVVPLRDEAGVSLARRRVRETAKELAFDLVTQTKVVTATSELARNALVHGGGGQLQLRVLEEAGVSGIELEFLDQGPGIPDLERALGGGWSSGKGLGLGLSGSRRLVHEFTIDARPGSGTRVRVVMWARAHGGLA